ncbi:NAD-dependent epimerase/dehydratase family protein [Liquorilactobacillus mali]|nr:NAD-dependent epimerase/dehydratase family protein [Liquorilactobacillus mali]MDN7145078.1 NAD-dependent epimerase/dehydratase family protein [Liquorilactobacillus mali]
MDVDVENTYCRDLRTVTSENIPWNHLKDKSILITGATGMIGSFLIDVVMQKNCESKLNCKIIAIGRNIEKAERRFIKYRENENFTFKKMNIVDDPIQYEGNVDFLIHAASNTHPKSYVSDPIGTITANVIGTNKLLNFCVQKKCKRFLFTSSVEVYGENRGDIEKFGEKYLGYIDCNTLRAGYPEGKRVAEALCQAYLKQKGQDFTIARLSRTYGPTMLWSDSKAISQFIKKGVKQEDIILKSKGTQVYSYSYVADTVRGLLYVLLLGKCGEAYNVSDSRSDVTLKDLAQIVANISGKKVVYELPDDLERQGYSTATIALLDSRKIQKLGYKAVFDIHRGLEHTIKLLKVR